MISERALALVVLGAVAVVYAPSLGGGWCWDDHVWAEIPASFQGILHGDGTSLWRPLGSLPLMALHALDASPVVHRVSSLAFHLVNVAAVALVMRGAGARAAIAWFAAACFGLHTGASEPVAWISGQTELVPAMLCLLGWAALVRGREGLAGLLFALAPFGKEAWALLLVALPLWMLGARKVYGRAWSAALAGCVTYVWMRSRMDVGGFSGGASQGVFGPLGAVTLRGLELLFVPASADAFAPYVAAPAVGVVATVLVLLAIAASRGRPAIAAALFAIPILAPNAIAGAHNGIVADRYFYLSLAGIAVALGLAVEALARRSPWTTGAPRGLVAVLALPLALGFLTAERACNWSDDETLARMSLARDPTNPFAAFRLAYDLHMRQGRCAEAIPFYQLAVEEDPRAVSGLQACLTTFGRHEDVVALAPSARTPAGRANVIRALLALGRVEEAVEAGRQAVAVSPDAANLHVLYGTALGRAGRFVDAVAAFDAALALEPGHADALRMRAKASELAAGAPTGP